MANEFFTLLTASGKAKLAAAQANGAPLQISQMAVGDGDNGGYYTPSESQTALKHETWRGALNHLAVDPNNPNWVVAEAVLPDTVGGFYIREVGLFDSRGDLIAIGKFPESYKPLLAAGSNKQLYVRMILEVSNTAAVTLLVDPSVVLATRSAVDQRIAEELAKRDLPLVALPLPCVATADNRMAVTAAAVAGQGGTVSVPAGIVIGLGQETLPGYGKAETFVSSAWTSPILAPGSEYFLRAQLVSGVLTCYVQKGALTDATPASLKGVANGTVGGGFFSTALDVCLARVITGAAGSVPVVQKVINRGASSWSATMNGSGTVYLPLDPFIKTGRITASTITPHPTQISSVSHGSGGWTGAAYWLGYPTGVGGNTPSMSSYLGWVAGAAVIITSNNVVGDAVVSTCTGMFEHIAGKSMWQVLQMEHQIGDASGASGDEHLMGEGTKNLLPADYDNGLAISYSNCVNALLTWEVVR
ncbi:phage tail protein [Chromobacterium haemolyticum]|uniref:phage tail protein n=1 Tax=Chromobacterium haemolyticum TaxID=394935 RepID=UPI004057986F